MGWDSSMNLITFLQQLLTKTHETSLMKSQTFAEPWTMFHGLFLSQDWCQPHEDLRPCHREVLMVTLAALFGNLGTFWLVLGWLGDHHCWRLVWWFWDLHSPNPRFPHLKNDGCETNYFPFGFRPGFFSTFPDERMNDDPIFHTFFVLRNGSIFFKCESTPQDSTHWIPRIFYKTPRWENHRCYFDNIEAISISTINHKINSQRHPH